MLFRSLRMEVLHAVTSAGQLVVDGVGLLLVEERVLRVQQLAVFVPFAQQLLRLRVQRLKVLEVDLLPARELDGSEDFEVKQLELLEGDE